MHSHEIIDPDETLQPWLVLEECYPPGGVLWHRHRRGQLVHASRGVITVGCGNGLWVVPPHRAVWVPPGMEHRIASRRPFTLQTLYVEPGVGQLPATCRVVDIDPLVAELLTAAARFDPRVAPSASDRHLMQVLLDRLPVLDVQPMHLPMPGDARLRRIVDVLVAAPASDETLDRLSLNVGITARTAARLFVRETGMGFVQWRQQLRLLVALERLGAGATVTDVALDVGYRDVSSFIAMFKDAFGTTPARYFKRSGDS